MQGGGRGKAIPLAVSCLGECRMSFFCIRTDVRLASASDKLKLGENNAAYEEKARLLFKSRGSCEMPIPLSATFVYRYHYLPPPFLNTPLLLLHHHDRIPHHRHIRPRLHHPQPTLPQQRLPLIDRPLHGPQHGIHVQIQTRAPPMHPRIRQHHLVDQNPRPGPHGRRRVL